MGKVVQYVHHGTLVKVDEDLKGTHRAHCLCFRSCAYFKPDDQDSNCSIARLLYDLCRAFDLVTPVYECGRYMKIS